MAPDKIPIRYQIGIWKIPNIRDLFLLWFHLRNHSQAEKVSTQKNFNPKGD